jgi:hypothetical protein
MINSLQKNVFEELTLENLEIFMRNQTQRQEENEKMMKFLEDEKIINGEELNPLFVSLEEKVKKLKELEREKKVNENVHKLLKLIEANLQPIENLENLAKMEPFFLEFVMQWTCLLKGI